MFGMRDGVEYLLKDENAGPGAPKGLLGLQGDGVPPKKLLKSNKSKKRARFDDWDEGSTIQHQFQKDWE